MFSIWSFNAKGAFPWMLSKYFFWMKKVSFPHSVQIFPYILCIWWLLKLTLKISRKFNIGIPCETSQIPKGLFAKMCENSSRWIFVKLHSWIRIFSLQVLTTPSWSWTRGTALTRRPVSRTDLGTPWQRRGWEGHHIILGHKSNAELVCTFSKWEHWVPVLLSLV